MFGHMFCNVQIISRLGAKSSTEGCLQEDNRPESFSVQANLDARTHSSLSFWQNLHPSALMRAIELLLRNNCWRELRPYREPLFTSVRLL